MLKPEILWRVDAAVDEARRLPDWREFHRLCGSGSRKWLCFDHIEREGRGAYVCQAFRIQRNDHGGYNTVPLAKGRGRTVIDALFDAYAQSGITVPGADVLIDRRLGGAAAGVPVASGDDFDCLSASDDFEELR